MREYPQFEDLGLVDNDRTDDLRPSKSAPEAQVLEHLAGTDPNNHIHITEQEF